MLHRGPVVISTLEEDFRKIGLIGESKTQTESADVEETDAAEGADDSETLDERRTAKRIAAGGRKMVRTKRTSVAKKMKAKRYYRKAKNFIKRKLKIKMRKPKARRRAKVLKMLNKRRKHEGAESPIANLIEEVADIVASIESAPKTDAIKSFANIAIISDLLANTFNEWSENLTEENSDQETFDTLVESAESLADLAEAAAELATALKEGAEIEGGAEELEAVFKEYMEDLLAAMDGYNEMTAQTESDDGDEDDEDEDEDEAEDDAEDDDAEDETESKKKAKKEATGDKEASLAKEGKKKPFPFKR